MHTIQHQLTPCHLVLSAPGALAINMMYLLHCLLSIVASLNSAKFIPVLSCISSIHFFLGRPLSLLPSPRAIIISFSNPFDLMICPKNPSFLLIAICCNVSSFSTPIFRRTSSFVFFSIHDRPILCMYRPTYVLLGLLNMHVVQCTYSTC